MDEDIDLSGAGDAVASVMKENAQATAFQIRNNIYNSATTSPDQAAEFQHLARFVGVPPETVRNKTDLIKRQAAAQSVDADGLVENSPATAHFLADQNGAEIAHDDVANLSALEKTIARSEMDTSFSSAFLQGLTQPIQSIGQTLEVLGMENAGSTLQSVQSPKNYLSAGTAFINPQEDDFSILGYAPQYAPRAVVEQLGQLLGSIGTRFLGAAAGASAGGAIGSAVPVVGTAAGAATGGAAGAFAGPFLFQAAQLVGPIAKERAQRNGYEKPTEEDLAYAWLTAAASGSLDAIGAKYLPGGEKATGTIVSKFVRSVFGEGLTESFQSTIEQGGGSLETKTGLQISPKQALGEGLIGGLTGGTATSVEVAANSVINRIATDRARVERAEQLSQQLQNINDLATASKVRARDATSFENFIISATENAPIQNLYIDAQTFAQTAGEKIAPIMEALPEVRNQIGTAIATGGNVRIPVSAFAAKIAGTDLAPALIPHLKTEPDGMSQVEAQEFMQTQGDRLMAEVQKVLNEKQEDDAFKASRDTVEKQLLEQLNATNRFTEDVNKPYAAAISNFYAVQAAKMNMTPEEMAKLYPLQIRAEVDDNGLPRFVGLNRATQYDIDKAAREQTLSEAPSVNELLNYLRKPPKEKKAETLIDFLRKQGGLQDQGGELKAMDAHKTRGLVKKEGGITLDEAALRATEQGFLNGNPNAERMSINDFLELLRRDLSNRDVVSDLSQAGEKSLHDQASELEAALFNSGIDYAGRDNADVIKEMQEKGLVSSPVEEVLNEEPAELFQARTSDAAQFAHDLDLLLRGETPKYTMLRLGQTPAVLQALGAKDLPLRISPKVLRKILIDKHDVHPNTAANLPNLIADPVMVFDSATHPGDLVVLIDANDTKGKPLTASIHLATGDVTINSVSSVYGRDNRGWVTRQIEEGRLRYANKEKASVWFRTSGLQLPSGEPFNPVNGGRKLKNSVLTEADIVKKNELFSKNQGSFNPQTLTISILKNADLSTVIHEAGHLFLHITADLAARPDAPIEIKQDMDALLKWFDTQGTTPEERLANWHSLSTDEQRLFHEQMARSFEAYLFSGKAPSLELQPIFQRIRAWLLNVYRSLHDFVALHPEGGKINDEVRGVFDRMLATSEQIKNAEAARGMEPLFKSAEEAGMTPDEFKEYQETSLQATQDAIQNLQARSLRDMQWLSNAKSRELSRLQKDAAEKRKAIRQEVTDEVMAEPVNQAREFLRKGTVNGETAEGSHRLDAKALREMYGDSPDALWRKLDNKYGKNGLVGKDGLHPDAAAELFGFSSGDELIRALVEAENPNDKIEGLTDQRMLERHGDLTDPQSMSRAADEAIHNEARLRFVATEMNALNKATGQRKTLTTAARQFATQMIDHLRVRDIRPSQYHAAETRAARAAGVAVGKGDLREAATQKRNQLIQGYAAKAAYEARDRVSKWVDYLRKFENDGTRKNLSADYLEQIDALLERFNLRERTLKAIDRSKSLASWLEAQREVGLEPEIPPELLDEAKRKHFKDMTFEEMRGLVDTVKQIEHLGRLKNKLLTAKDLREFAAIVDGMVASIKANAGTKTKDNRTRATELDRVIRLFKGFFASHRKIASLSRELDGFKDGGAVWETFIRTMNDAGNKEAVMREQATMKLAELVKPIMAGGKMGGKGIFFPSINQSLNREERIGIALNTGNAGNLQRLLDGEGWTPEKITPVLETLTKEDWDFVQSIWDFFETYRPEIAAKEKRVYGKEPDWVEPVPVATKHGTYRGGYYPIKYDPRRSVVAERHADAELARQQLKGAFTSSTTRRSFTKTRATQVKGRPLLYSLEGLYSGVNEVIHDLSWHEWLIDANRLLRNTSLDNAIRTHYGAETVRQFKDAIKDIAAGEMPSGDALEKVLGNLRTGATIAGLGFNIVNSVINVTGVTQSFVRIGPRWVAQGLAEWIKSPVGLIEQIHQKSDFMRLRAKTMQREINEIQSMVRGKNAVRAALDRAMFWPIAMTQVAVDTPSWWGAYQKALTEGNDEKRAVALADQAVIDAQGSGQIKDLAAIQRGGPVQKLLTTFYGFFSTTYNLSVEQAKATNFKDPMQVLKLGGDFLLLYSIPAALGTILRSAIGGGDDPDELAKKLANDQISYLMGVMVGLREAASFAQKAFGVQQFNSAYGGPAGLRFFNALDQLGSQIGQGDLDKALLKSVVNVGGIALRLPATQINRTIDGIAALASGKTSNPLAIILGAPQK